MVLRFGIFDHQERRRDVPLDQQYEERLQLVAEADRLGFYAYHLAEHHSSPLCTAPSQSLFLAAAAQRTERILLGALVYLLPMYHPLRLIEEICMLDNLTGGRLQVGVGRGISPLEHGFWGHEPEESKARFEETLAIVVEGLTHDELSYSGTYYQFDDVPLELGPKQRPYPPFWYAGNVETAAAKGMNFLGGGPVSRLPAMAGRYRELYDSARAAGTTLNPQVSDPVVGSVRHVFVADTDAEAEAIGRRAWTAYHNNFPKRGHGPEHAGPTAAVGGPSMGGNFDLARQVETAVVGSPETIAAFLNLYATESDLSYFVGAFQWGDLTHAEAVHSMKLFAAVADRVGVAARG
jgi:alkanesulfonate monooxygenase SsuD/methylene tetrahydromethanopterin reductase-like flavin-dependent oxidoreductase (luciferase family)